MSYTRTGYISCASASSTLRSKTLIVLILWAALFTISVNAIEFKSKLLDVVESKFGYDARLRLLSWKSTATQVAELTSEQAQLKVVNDFFNKARFVDDYTLWGKEDYWATPVELLAKNAGDCEDYAIAKFFTLIDAGFDESKLQISYVKALELNQAHMVLAYYPAPDAEPLILDNLNHEILPATQRTDLEPVYSFNGLGLWLNRFERENSKRIGEASAMDEWNDMLRRQGILMLKRDETL